LCSSIAIWIHVSVSPPAGGVRGRRYKTIPQIVPYLLKLSHKTTPQVLLRASFASDSARPPGRPHRLQHGKPCTHTANPRPRKASRHLLLEQFSSSNHSHPHCRSGNPTHCGNFHPLSHDFPTKKRLSLAEYTLLIFSPSTLAGPRTK
jgi:hypothetical protein